MFSFWWFTLWLIIFEVVISLILIFGFNKDSDSVGGSSVVIFIIYFVLSTTMFFTSVFSEHETTDRKISYETYSLKSLSSQTQTSGSAEYGGGLFFRYGSAKIGEDFYYYLMVGDDENGYLIKKYKSDEVYLFLDGDDNPRFIKTLETKTMGYNKNFLYGGLFKKLRNNIVTKKIKEEVHIPKDAIQIDYDINMPK